MVGMWRVREYRLQRGLSQQQLADEVDVNRNTISTYETGKETNWTSELVARVAKALNVSISELAGEVLMRPPFCHVLRGPAV